MVTQVTYANAEQNTLRVEPEGWSMPWPSNTWHREAVQDWLDAGNTIAPYVKPVSEVRAEKLSELSAAFNAEASADVVTPHGTFSGGSESAMTVNGKAETVGHRGNPNGTIHTLGHVAVTLNVNQMKDVAADISEAYNTVYDKLQTKLLAIDTCGEDSACINSVVW